MTTQRELRGAAMQAVTARFSLAWLAAANAIGIWLALLLLWPRLGGVAGSFGYGRWMPLHMDWQLYGWCSLPLLGMLAIRYWDHGDKGRERCRLSYWVWSASLLVGGVSWLFGEVTGKPFLNWSGFARWFFVLGLAFVWAMVARGWWERWNEQRDSLARRILMGLLVVGLAGVPVSLYWVSDAEIYPPVNPSSGGATGHSLMISTLGIVSIMGILPGWGLGLGKKEGKVSAVVFWVAYGASILGYLMIEHGSVANTALDQVLGLGSLMVWPLLVWWFWSDFDWAPETRIWKVAFLFWWGLLAVSGWLTFLPGILDTWKFTNGLVGHAHLAMAGMVTALNMMILINLGGSEAVRSSLGNAKSSVGWNAALLVFVVAFLIQGWREGLRPGVLFGFDGGTQLAYLARLVAGIVMTVCSLAWWNGLRGARARGLTI